MALEHHAAIQTRARHLAAGHDHDTGARFVEPGEDIEYGRLAAARMADDADELAFVDREIDFVEHHERRAAARRHKRFFQTFDPEEFHALSLTQDR